MECFGEGLAEGREEVLWGLAAPSVAHGVFDLVFRFGGEATNTEQVVGADWFHGCDPEGDGFRGPNFSVQEDLALHFSEVVD